MVVTDTELNETHVSELSKIGGNAHASMALVSAEVIAWIDTCRTMRTETPSDFYKVGSLGNVMLSQIITDSAGRYANHESDTNAIPGRLLRYSQTTISAEAAGPA
jgi:hypothetical protein